jgi:hypothetical protein
MAGSILLSLLCVLGSLCDASPVFAEQPIHVQASTYSLMFGQEVRFHLRVDAPDPIRSIVLAYRTSDNPGTIVETMAFDQGTTVTVDYVHQIRERYIRPFVQVTYWWTIDSMADARLTTEPQTFVYADNRFDWQALSQNVITVHWYRGDVQAAQKALDVAISGLDRARQDIDISTGQPIDVYLYENVDDMQAALPADTPAGTDALTLYETSVILVASGLQEANVLDLERILPHEVTHALIHEVTQSDYDGVPLWLSEGLATSVQYTFSPDPDAQLLMQQAARDQSLISLDTLCAAFPQSSARARLAYAESASVITYIRNRYGRQALRDLVAAYGDGATCEGGVQRVLALSLDRLQAQWSQSLAPQSGWRLFWQNSGAWVVLLALLFLVVLALVIPVRAREVPRPRDDNL